MTDSAEKVRILVEEVTQGSVEQARGIEHVAKAITHMERLTQATAANAEENASASAMLKTQSQTLSALVVQLENMVSGCRS